MIRHVSNVLLAAVLMFAMFVATVTIFNHSQLSGIMFIDDKITWWQIEPIKLQPQSISKIKREDIDLWRHQTWNFDHKEDWCCDNVSGVEITFAPIFVGATHFGFWFYRSGQIRWIVRRTYGEVTKIIEFHEDGTIKYAVPPAPGWFYIIKT